ncbi:hypothetical protein SAMN02745244_01055 [Tessaracoccus bendigoensis DSM 12906]|uniref:Short-chain dehydrogenase n=1 Tax=Tessaracoccus bendigoensis DSM 12906 TaxID=1123357 RepID=A0A1M6E0I1_9ACTN|nr:SDR family oxidoreductase [Tessaracoccus bendigoensis]SHI78895.1 hypothetical protein SAMN02745244_01055 [Tessaracoccus bendigoensis DSM 12906]
MTGRVVAVAGGANGIGREIARELALTGARVAIGDLDGGAARRVATELGDPAIGLDLDVTSAASFDAFLEAVKESLGAPDVLIGSAGVMWVGAFSDEPARATRAMLDVNLLGVIHGVQAAARQMVPRGRGHIVMITSAASVLPTPGEATYAASKHGALGYLKAVRAELRGSGVKVSAVMPTVVDTAMAVGTSPGAAKLLQPADVARAVVRTVGRPRFEVTVPGYVGPTKRVVDLLPERLRDAVLRRLVPDQVHESDHAARVGYESRFLGG